MREINLPITQTYSITIDREKLDLSKAVDAGDGRRTINLGIVVDGTITAKVEVARKNGGKILYATTSVEQTIESLLLNYFMGPFVDHEDRRELFEHEVLQSSALSFRAKKDLVIKVIHNENLLKGSSKDAAQKHLKNIMEWRNAFAHGNMQHDTAKGCFICHYSGGPKTLVLDAKYWDEVEKTFKECVELLKEALQQLAKKQQAE